MDKSTEAIRQSRCRKCGTIMSGDRGAMIEFDPDWNVSMTIYVCRECARSVWDVVK